MVGMAERVAGMVVAILCSATNFHKFKLFSCVYCIAVTSDVRTEKRRQSSV